MLFKFFFDSMFSSLKKTLIVNNYDSAKTYIDQKSRIQRLCLGNFSASSLFCMNWSLAVWIILPLFLSQLIGAGCIFERTELYYDNQGHVQVISYLVTEKKSNSRGISFWKKNRANIQKVKAESWWPHGENER